MLDFGDLCDEPNFSILTSPGDGATLPVLLLVRFLFYFIFSPACEIMDCNLRYLMLKFVVQAYFEFLFI